MGIENLDDFHGFLVSVLSNYRDVILQLIAYNFKYKTSQATSSLVTLFSWDRIYGRNTSDIVTKCFRCFWHKHPSLANDGGHCWYSYSNKSCIFPSLDWHVMYNLENSALLSKEQSDHFRKKWRMFLIGYVIDFNFFDKKMTFVLVYPVCCFGIHHYIRGYEMENRNRNLLRSLLHGLLERSTISF